MMQCEECEFFSRDEATGRIMLRCDPFRTIKEPACLDKWQMVKLDGLLQSYQATLRWYQQLAPMQQKMFKFIEREMDDIDEAEEWKRAAEDEDEEHDESDDDQRL